MERLLPCKVRGASPLQCTSESAMYVPSICILLSMTANKRVSEEAETLLNWGADVEGDFQVGMLLLNERLPATDQTTVSSCRLHSLQSNTSNAKQRETLHLEI